MDTTDKSYCTDLDFLGGFKKINVYDNTRSDTTALLYWSMNADVKHFFYLMIECHLGL